MENKEKVLHRIFSKQNGRHLEWECIDKIDRKDIGAFADLTLDDLLFVIGISCFPYRAPAVNPIALDNYPESLRQSLSRSRNFLLFKEQFQALYLLAGGEKKNADQFVRDWNLKRPEVRNELVGKLHIGSHSLKSIIETLSYDQSHFFAYGERYELASEFANAVNCSVSSDGMAKQFLGISFIDYLGDSSNDKRDDIKMRCRSHINLSTVNENALFLIFELERAGVKFPIKFNLLGKEVFQDELYLMQPSFVVISDRTGFVFSTMVVWLIDDDPQHFEFSVRYAGRLPEYVPVSEMY